MTPELAALTAHMKTGPPARLTSGQRAPRFRGDKSNHIAGLAADFAGPTPWNKAVKHEPLYNIWKFWMLVAGSLRELIYSGGSHYISKGLVRPIADLDDDLRAAHWNHVHVAVPKGWTAPKGIVVPETPAPSRPVVNAPVTGIAITPSGKGYLLVCADGGVFAFGDAPFLGNVEYRLPATQLWTPKA